MARTKRLQLTVLIITAAASVVSWEGRAEKSRGDSFLYTAAIEKWAKQSYFGGAHVEKFSKGGNELVVVSGMPTSGLLTSQLVVLGRGNGKTEYHVILRTAVFMGDVKVRQEKDGLRADAEGKGVLYIPFDLAGLVVHSGP